jgi:hypothetical protein
MPELVLNQAILDARVARARSATDDGVRYKLGRGGFNPRHVDNVAWDSKECDCSGFVSWVLMTKRAPKAGRPFWIETTAVHRDATTSRQVFRQIATPVPGCISVFPDRERPHHEGHMGIVTRVHADGSYDVVDCASRGIRERLDTYLRANHAIFCVLKQDFVRQP